MSGVSSKMVVLKLSMASLVEIWLKAMLAGQCQPQPPHRLTLTTGEMIAMASDTMAAPSKAKMDAQEKKWRAESDFDSLRRAEEVRSDKDRHKLAIAHGKERVKQETRALAISK